jgi:hypothetical protein
MTEDARGQTEAYQMLKSVSDRPLNISYLLKRQDLLDLALAQARGQ